MDHNQAINILIQAAHIAQSKGAFTLEEAEVISNAIKAFKAQQSPVESATPQPVPEDIA